MALYVINVDDIELKILLGRHLFHIAQSIVEIQERISAMDSPATPISISMDDLEEAVSRLKFICDPKAATKCLYLFVYDLLIVEIDAIANCIDSVLDEPTLIIYRKLVSQLHEHKSEFVCFVERTDSEDCVDLVKSAKGLSVDKLQKFGLPIRPGRKNNFDDATPFSGINHRESDLRSYVLSLSHAALMNLEIATIECCARIILEFGDEMPFAFSLDLSRQCWDESRHALGFYNRIKELGGYVGMFPSQFDLWDMSTDQPLGIRLAAHQQIGEWIGVDAVINHAKTLCSRGDEKTAAMLEFIIVDEISHVAIGNKWIHYLFPNVQDAKKVFEDAMRLRVDFDVNPGMPYPFNEWACIKAGYSEQEIQMLVSNFKINRS